MLRATVRFLNSQPSGPQGVAYLGGPMTLGAHCGRTPTGRALPPRPQRNRGRGLKGRRRQRRRAHEAGIPFSAPPGSSPLSPACAASSSARFLLSLQGSERSHPAGTWDSFLLWLVSHRSFALLGWIHFPCSPFVVLGFVLTQIEISFVHSSSPTQLLPPCMPSMA